MIENDELIQEGKIKSKESGKSFYEMFTFSESIERKKHEELAYNAALDKSTDSMNLSSVLDSLICEIDRQHKRKENIETRSGFIFAYLGVLMSVFLTNTEDYCCLGNKNIGIAWIALTTVTGLASIVLTLSCLWSSDLQSFNFNNYRFIKFAIEDRSFSRIDMCFTCVEIIDKNEGVVARKGKVFNITIILTIVFSILVLLFMVC